MRSRTHSGIYRSLQMRHILNYLAPFEVRCGRARHRTHSFAEALDWLSQYPPDWGYACVLSLRTDRTLAARDASEH